MDPSLMMLLPKGIVLNIDRVYKEVATYPVVPPEKIYEYWHVYTTTYGKLKDPTASRLENFWWHVLGSDRKRLSGKTLARIFEHISNGPTFVRLLGPPNRYEPPSSPPTPIKKSPAASRDPESNHQQSSAEGGSSSTSGSARPLQSSSSKPPPAHPILKKPRGPSTSGPRPTARFASPPESQAEDEKKESEGDSSASATVNHVLETKPAAGGSNGKEKTKKLTASAPKKKTPTFVASSSSKRRPAMPRRQSSQSSVTGSEVGSREDRSSLSVKQSVPQRSVSPIAEKPSNGTQPTRQDSELRLSSKAAGKQPAAKATLDVTDSCSSGASQITPNLRDRAVAAPSTNRSSQPLPARGGENGTAREQARKGQTEAPAISKAGAGGPTLSEVSAPSMARSRSDMGISRHGTREAKPNRRGLPQGLTSASTATTSNVAAQGTIIEFDENAPARAIASAINTYRDEFEEGGLQRSASSVNMTPTAPSNVPSVPLGRSKSQLTLLLERQGDKKPRR